MNLESSYDCSQASVDLPKLLEQLDALQRAGGASAETEQQINHLQNQIRFIRNKCSIPGQAE
ncbi:DUF2524 domain-containing protein [Paenibacillus thailandensis]|uniref:DUF2524 domain-containing protein n=1 Tax=Paenibacillus thailandensis TaxID=393250 RepID=A0ABW5QZA3_9BACL